jgi:hypothetical protein
MGSVADAILLQMVDEIVDLDDITEVESEKLAEMCKKMEPIQNLFIDSNGEVGHSYHRFHDCSLLQISPTWALMRNPGSGFLT